MSCETSPGCDTACVYGGNLGEKRRMQSDTQKQNTPDSNLATYHMIASLALTVISSLGCSYNENIYHKAFLHELALFNIPHETEKVIPVLYRQNQIGVVRADIIVQNNMVVELKCVAKVTTQHLQQPVRYAQLLKLNQAILINFPITPDTSLQIFSLSGNEWTKTEQPYAQILC